MDVNGKQSWPSAFVDTAIIASVVALCFVPNVSPMAWSVLGQIALVRFGVAVTKQAFGNANGGVPPSDRSGGNGSSGGGGVKSDPPPPRRKQQDTPPSDTLRRVAIVHAMPMLVILVAMMIRFNR